MIHETRSVPIRARVAGLFGGPIVQIGWGVFAFGAIFGWAFFPVEDLVAAPLYVLGTTEVTGTVTSVDSTGASDGNTRVYAIHFAWEASDGSPRTGISHKTGPGPTQGSTVKVVHPRGFPQLARIAHLRRSTFGYDASFVLIFPLLGLAFLSYGLWRGFSSARLLGQGTLALGRLVAKSPTNTTVNNRRVWKLTFAFVANDGETHHASARTSMTQKLEDEAEELLLYDPRDPNRAVMIDNLPGGTQLDENGQIVPPSALRTLALLILPTVAVAINLLAATIKLSR